MAFLDDVRVALRTSTTMTDPEIEVYIEAALAHMRLVGVRKEFLEREDLAAMVARAVFMYCKANYGYDNDQAGQFYQWYEQTVISMLNSSMNECANGPVE